MVYTAIKDGKEIGTLLLIAIQNGNERILSSESKLKFELLIRFDVLSKVYNKLTGNVLVKSSAYRTLNGRVKMDNLFCLSDGLYKAIKGDPAKNIHKPIYHTVISLYFLEPVGLKEIFSEVSHCLIPIEKLSESTYRTPLPDGGAMEYYYRNGVLIKVVATSSLATIRFELKQA